MVKQEYALKTQTTPLAGPLWLAGRRSNLNYPHKFFVGFLPITHYDTATLAVVVIANSSDEEFDEDLVIPQTADACIATMM